MAFCVALAAVVLESALAAADEQSPGDDVMPGKVRLVLPPVVYATPGVECNIYFDNVVLTTNVANYAFRVSCPKGLQYQERWAYTPAMDDAGEYPLTIEVHDEQNQVVARAQTKIRAGPCKADGPGYAARSRRQFDRSVRLSAANSRIEQARGKPAARDDRIAGRRKQTTQWRAETRRLQRVDGRGVRHVIRSVVAIGLFPTWLNR